MTLVCLFFAFFLSFFSFCLSMHQRYPCRRWRRRRTASMMEVTERQWQIFPEFIAGASVFLSGTLKKCMNLIEFSCLQVVTNCESDCPCSGISRIYLPSQPSKFRTRMHLREIIINLRLLAKFFKVVIYHVQTNSTCRKTHFF